MPIIPENDTLQVGNIIFKYPYIQGKFADYQSALNLQTKEISKIGFYPSNLNKLNLVLKGRYSSALIFEFQQDNKAVIVTPADASDYDFKCAVMPTMISTF
jgi:hypothetical protein